MVVDGVDHGEDDNGGQHRGGDIRQVRTKGTSQNNSNFWGRREYFKKINREGFLRNVQRCRIITFQ